MTGPIHVTPAQAQAGVLVAVAAHLCAHPLLPRVSVSALQPEHRTQLHITRNPDRDRQLGDLLDWAASLGAEHLHVQRTATGGVNLEARGRIVACTGFGHAVAAQVAAWSDVPQLHGIDPDVLPEGAAVTVADLVTASVMSGDLPAALASVRGGSDR